MAVLMELNCPLAFTTTLLTFRQIGVVFSVFVCLFVCLFSVNVSQCDFDVRS